MADNVQLIEAFDSRVKRRSERRDFFKTALGAAAAGATALALPRGAKAQTIGDGDVLNFALNLEYLEAQFYSYAVYGTGLPADQLTGQQTRGSVIGGRKVTFTDPVIAQYAREIAADEAAHVAFLRSVLGGVAVAMPTIDIDGSASGAFTAAARAAGVVGATGTFDPYASDEAFLLGAFIFEDVGVTAYKGAAPLVTNKTYLEAAAGILAAEAYHAGLVRTSLYRKGIATPSAMLIENAGKISDARDSLDGPGDLDQGIASPDGGVTSNIVPTDSNGIAFSRSAGQVLNIAYLSKSSLSSGGFFPNGINGFIHMSAAN